MCGLEAKYDSLKEYLRSLGSVAVAFSGGVDSTFLAKTAYDVLNERSLAVTATSSTYPARELEEAKTLAAKIGIRHIVIVSEELDIKGYAENPKDRCYYCKYELFTKLKAIAAQNSIEYVTEGSNMDDLGDYRPGLKAAAELSIISPLRAAKLCKSEIRQLSKQLSLPTWDKPAFACLASRVPYGQNITREKLDMIDEAEQYIMSLGFRQVRVRHHGDTARIELPQCDMPLIFERGLAAQINQRINEIGFAYVALDLKGYRTGSMNEVL